MFSGTDKTLHYSQKQQRNIKQQCSCRQEFACVWIQMWALMNMTQSGKNHLESEGKKGEKIFTTPEESPKFLIIIKSLYKTDKGKRRKHLFL